MEARALTTADRGSLISRDGFSTPPLGGRPQVQIVQNPERPGRERSTSGTNGAAAVPPGRHCEREAPPPGAALSCIISEQHVEVGPALGGATITGCWRCGGAKPTSVAVTLLPPSAVSHADDLAAFIAHVNALRTLEHPNVLRFYGVVLTQPLTMVSELAPLGSLRDALRQRRCNRPPAARPQPPLLLRLAAQVAAALAFLEGRGCVHRLPAARRVFLASGGELAKLAVPEAPSRPRPRGAAPPRGTGRRRWWRPLPHGWWAPETLRSGTFSHASDAWTFGVLLWEMFTGGKDPWQGLSVAKGNPLLGKCLSKRDPIGDSPGQITIRPVAFVAPSPRRSSSVGGRSAVVSWPSDPRPFCAGILSLPEPRSLFSTAQRVQCLYNVRELPLGS
ncbi:unnamed protein product [Lampetra fluviatilis]